MWGEVATRMSGGITHMESRMITTQANMWEWNSGCIHSCTRFCVCSGELGKHGGLLSVHLSLRQVATMSGQPTPHAHARSRTPAVSKFEEATQQQWHQQYHCRMEEWYGKTQSARRRRRGNRCGSGGSASSYICVDGSAPFNGYITHIEGLRVLLPPADLADVAGGSSQGLSRGMCKLCVASAWARVLCLSLCGCPAAHPSDAFSWLWS